MTTKCLRKSLHRYSFLFAIFITFFLPSANANTHVRYSPQRVIEALDENKRELMEKYGRSVFPIYAEIKALITTKGGQKEDNVVKDIGTAWVVRSDGYLLTAYHVVDTNKVREEYAADIRKKYAVLPISEEVIIAFRAEYYIQDLKKRKFPIEIVAVDAGRSRDLALLLLGKRWGLSFRPLPLGDFTKLPYGSVISIGTPLGIPNMVADGTLAADSLRDCSQKEGNDKGDFLLVMSPSNPGNSGGPMILRQTGEMLAMVDAILLTEYGHSYITCGIPSSTIREFLDKNLPPRK